jgi:hypothetical protein
MEAGAGKIVFPNQDPSFLRDPDCSANEQWRRHQTHGIQDTCFKGSSFIIGASFMVVTVVLL